jgi:hypothetical protein
MCRGWGASTRPPHIGLDHRGDHQPVGIRDRGDQPAELPWLKVVVRRAMIFGNSVCRHGLIKISWFRTGALENRVQYRVVLAHRSRSQTCSRGPGYRLIDEARWHHD